MELDGRLARPDRRAAGDYCPISRTLELVGPRTSFLLLREAFYGTTRFDDFVHRTGFSEAVVAARLKELVGDGLLTKEPYREAGQRARSGYVLTPAGTDLMPVLLALATWGAEHLPKKGTPVWTHEGCGSELVVEVRCTSGHVVTDEETLVSA